MKLKNKKILIFVADLFEDLELFYPKYRMLEEGAKILVAGVKEKETYHSKHGYPCIADLSFEKVEVNSFDALIIPGGYAPDKLRKNSKVLEIIKEFNVQKKLIAFICHAGWLPISAKVIKDVAATSYITIKDDMINAGAKWKDKAVVVDKNFISSRQPDDLPFFCLAIIDYLSRS